MPSGAKYLAEPNEGHIEVANRVIRIEKLEIKYKNLITTWSDPVDFLVFVEGALKIGNRWGERVITYYPHALARNVRDEIESYVSRNYRKETVYPPNQSSILSFYV